MNSLPQRYLTWLLRNAILPAGDMIFDQRIMTRLRFLEEAQWWDRERLHEVRDSSLASLLAVAYAEVPFYRDLMDEAGVRPKDVSSASDLRRLPVVTKEMLRRAYPHRTTRRTGHKTYETSTSGSTGTNFRVMTDSETDGRRRAPFLLAVEWAGWAIGEPHLQTGISPDRGPVKMLKDFFLRCHYVSAFDLHDERLDASLDMLERSEIRHVRGFPGSLYHLARRALERGWNQPMSSVATWGDNLYPHYRRTIEQAFGARVFDTYGCAEGVQIAAQCGHDDTYHIHALDVIVEHLDADGRPVPPGTAGDIVVTRLHPGPMPLIRYKVGDVGMAGVEEPCECGRGLDVMGPIQGRDTDIVFTPSGNRLIVHFFTGILEHFPQIDAFQVVQEQPQAIVLRIVPTEEFSTEVGEAVVSDIKQHGAADLHVEVELVDEIPVPPSGKRRFVINNLKTP